MSKLDGAAVAKLLREFGERMALAGADYFRSRAYLRAAERIAALSEPLNRVVDENRLREIPGIGEAIADIVVQLHRTGTHPSLERMRQDAPASVLEMLSIPGLRPEKINMLHEKLGIASIAELEAAVRADRLKSVKGLGPALQRKILQGLEIREKTKGARHVHRAAELIAAAADNLQQSELGFRRIVPAGDLRRGGELVSGLAVVAEAGKLNRGPTVVNEGELSVYVTDPAHFGATLLFATGSREHLRELSDIAQSLGLELTANGLHKNGRRLSARTEAQIYQTLGLPYIEPELREGRGEIERARAGKMPELVTAEGIRGVLHAHTEASDGVNTLEEMAGAALSRGYQYLGVTDHSQSAHYAGGLSVAEIDVQHAEIERLNASFGGRFRIFKGIESDILADGSLDYPEDVLRRFDFIIGSVHSQFRLDREVQTQRLLRAIANPFVSIIGHLTGRQLLRRPGYELDIERVLAACAEHGVAMEINGNPWRLDLDWRWHQRGLDLGCLFSINPDAHSIPEIDSSTRWGVAMARKGGIGPDRVVNALDAETFAGWLLDRKAKWS